MDTLQANERIRNNIAANLRRLLERRGWTQAELAQRSGETEATISRIMRAQQMPGAGILARIAVALDVSQDRLTA